MVKTISSSELRTHIKRVLNEVEYGQMQYLVEKFGQPAAAIVSLEDFHLLQLFRRQQAASSLRSTLGNLRRRAGEVDPAELSALVEEARAEFLRQQSDAA